MQRLSPLLQIGRSRFPPGRATSTWCPAAGVWNINLTLAGCVQEILPQGQTRQNPGDFMVLKPRGSHAWIVPEDEAEPWEVVWFVFVPRPEWIPMLDLPEEFPRFSRIPLRGTQHERLIRKAMVEAHQLASDPGEDGQALAMNALERALLWLQRGRSGGTRLDPRVQAAMQLFSRRLARPPSVPEAAAASGLSSSRLGELFRQSTGQSPREWHENLRLRHAKDLIQATGLAMKSIASDCGYHDQRHFATRFKKEFGMTPSACRNLVRDGR